MNGFRLDLYQIQLLTSGEHVGRVPLLHSVFVFDASRDKFRHESVNHSADEYARVGTDIHTNTVESAFSLLKRGIIGTWHKVSAKHLSDAYLDEMTFRFNRRNRHDLFLDTLRRMVTADPLTFDKLTA